MGARRKTVNIPAIVKAYQAEAKRADYRAKHGINGAPIGHTWASYAAACRVQAANAMRYAEEAAPEPEETTPEPVRDEFAHLPSDQAAWARHLMQLDRADLERYARRKGVKI